MNAEQKFILCRECHQPAPRTGPAQRYCEPCSTAKHHARQGFNSHPSVNLRRKRVVRSEWKERGRSISKETATTIAETYREVDLDWVVRVSMPFSYAASKNRIYTMRAGGHVAMRRSATEYKDAITLLIQSKLRDIKIRQNKLWVDIFVQKDNHKGDAVNVVDLVCDAVKVAVGLDDRWFSLRRVDWEIVKHDPRLFIGIGQEAVDDVQACSCCGRLLPFPAFNKKASTKIGVERVCRECRIATDPKKFLNGAAL